MRDAAHNYRLGQPSNYRLKRSHIGRDLLDLCRRQAFAKCGHIAFSIFYNTGDLGGTDTAAGDVIGVRFAAFRRI